MLALANAIKTANNQEGSLERLELAQETELAQLDASAETRVKPCLKVCVAPYVLDRFC